MFLKILIIESVTVVNKKKNNYKIQFVYIFDNDLSI